MFYPFSICYQTIGKILYLINLALKLSISPSTLISNFIKLDTDCLLQWLLDNVCHQNDANFPSLPCLDK